VKNLVYVFKIPKVSAYQLTLRRSKILPLLVVPSCILYILTKEKGKTTAKLSLPKELYSDIVSVKSNKCLYF